MFKDAIENFKKKSNITIAMVLFSIFLVIVFNLYFYRYVYIPKSNQKITFIPTSKQGERELGNENKKITEEDVYVMVPRMIQLLRESPNLARYLIKLLIENPALVDYIKNMVTKTLDNMSKTTPLPTMTPGSTITPNPTNL
jgi:hypothetical protein